MVCYVFILELIVLAVFHVFFVCFGAKQVHSCG